MKPASKAAPRLALLIPLAAIGYLYLLFLIISIRRLAGAWSHPASAMSAAAMLPEGDFARFWYVGKMLVLSRLEVLGIHIAPSAWLLQTFKLNLFASSGDTQFDWIYPPTMNLLAMLASLLPLGTSFFFVWDIATLCLAAWLLRLAGLD